MVKKVLIRHGVFETNSSSSHSISLGRECHDFVLDYIEPNIDGEIHVIQDDFGWEWFKTNDVNIKLSYAYTDGISKELLKDIIIEKCGDVIVTFGGEGYIDHDSSFTTPRDKDELINFLFNKNSWLFGGNDNDDMDSYDYNTPILKN